MNKDIQIYHDALLQHGGAEHVAIQWVEALKTDLNVLAASDEFSSDLKFKPKIMLSWLHTQRALELLYPFLPLIYPFIKCSSDKVRLVSTTGIAHHFPGHWKKRVLYIHSPARWIWDKKSFDMNRKKIEILVANLLRPLFKFYDRRAIREDDLLIVNSNATRQKVKKVYSRDSFVIFPPIAKKITESQMIDLPSEFSSFFLHVGRVRGYKGIDFLLETFGDLELKLVMVGESTEQFRTNSILGLGYVSSSELRWLYENAEALLAVSREDFGLTPVEAASYGCPTLAFRHFGYLDSVKEGINGTFVTPNDLKEMQYTILNHQKRNFSYQSMQEFVKPFMIESHIEKLRTFL